MNSFYKNWGHDAPIPSGLIPGLCRQRRKCDDSTLTVPEAQHTCIDSTPHQVRPHTHCSSRLQLPASFCMPDSTTLATALLLAAAAALLIAAMLYPSALLRWFQRKRYQYEVTFSLYMLTSTEKFIFSASPWPSPSHLHMRTTKRCIQVKSLPADNCRLGTIPAAKSLDHRRIPLPPCARQHHPQPHLLLLQRQRERPQSCAQGRRVTSTPTWRRASREWKRVHGTVRSELPRLTLYRENAELLNQFFEPCRPLYMSSTQSIRRR